MTSKCIFILLLIAILFIAFGIFIFSLMRISSELDRMEEEQHKREKEEGTYYGE